MTTIGLSYSLVKISTKCAPALRQNKRRVNLAKTFFEKKFCYVREVQDDALEGSCCWRLGHCVEMRNRMLKAVERVFYQCELLCCHGFELKRLTVIRWKAVLIQ